MLALHSIACSSESTQPLPLTKIDLHQQKIFLWLPQQPVPIEQALTLRLEVPENVTPELSQVEGVSMYMGTIPLMWQQLSPTEWQATLYLGACTDPKMEWRLTVPLRHELATVPQSVSYLFTSAAN